MKKKLILVNIIIVFMLGIFLLATPVQAEKVDTSIITGSTFTDEFNPNKQTSKEEETLTKPITKSITTIVNKVLGIIQIIGGILTLISVAVFGFNRLISSDKALAADLGLKPAHGQSPDTRVALLTYGRSMVIGSIFLFSSVTIVRFVFNIFM